YDDKRVEFEIAVIGIVLAPIPLLAGGLHREIGLWGVELHEQEPKGRDGDQYQDDDWQDGPDHFDQRVMRRARRRRIGPGIEADHDRDQQDQDEDDDRGDDHQQQVMKRGDVGHDRRGGLL